jgi:hypothetical protein
VYSSPLDVLSWKSGAEKLTRGAGTLLCEVLPGEAALIHIHVAPRTRIIIEHVNHIKMIFLFNMKFLFNFRIGEV